MPHRSGFGGHPRGLTTLFFTELWERFSYYGMRAILVLYMVTPAAQGGLGFDAKRAASIYGTYTMSVYLTAIPGGLLADRVLGARLAVLSADRSSRWATFPWCFGSMAAFYARHGPDRGRHRAAQAEHQRMVGSLYGENDPRRDSGFSLFYMGINIGAVLAPLVCGYMAQSAGFKSFVASHGLRPFDELALGFRRGGRRHDARPCDLRPSRRRLAHVGPAPPRARTTAPPLTAAPLDARRLEAHRRHLHLLSLFTILFWAAYEQKGASLNLFALTSCARRSSASAFPSSWLQSLTPFFVILLAPIFSVLWVKMGRRQPSSPVKFALGLTFIGLAYVLLVPGRRPDRAGRISPLWLVGLYFLEVAGEMCISPVGLSTVTKLAPARLVGIMMGVWFLAAALGNKLAGYPLRLLRRDDAGTLVASMAASPRDCSFPPQSSPFREEGRSVDGDGAMTSAIRSLWRYQLFGGRSLRRLGRTLRPSPQPSSRPLLSFGDA